MCNSMSSNMVLTHLRAWLTPHTFQTLFQTFESIANTPDISKLCYLLDHFCIHRCHMSLSKHELHCQSTLDCLMLSQHALMKNTCCCSCTAFQTVTASTWQVCRFINLLIPRRQHVVLACQAESQKLLIVRMLILRILPSLLELSALLVLVCLWLR